MEGFLSHGPKVGQVMFQRKRLLGPKESSIFETQLIGMGWSWGGRVEVNGKHGVSVTSGDGWRAKKKQQFWLVLTISCFVASRLRISHWGHTGLNDLRVGLFFEHMSMSIHYTVYNIYTLTVILTYISTWLWGIISIYAVYIYIYTFIQMCIYI